MRPRPTLPRRHNGGPKLQTKQRGFLGIGMLAGGALAGIVGGVAGDITSAVGTANTNEANQDINAQQLNAAWARQQDSENFNAFQAQLARNFSAQQVSQQEDFQKGELSQVEGYDTAMSNTAMQRRMSDLRSAGVNPLLAVGQGGASAPTVNAPSGSSAQGAQASVGIGGANAIAMQNPTAAFGNLGGTVNSSIEASKTGAAIDLLNAQADKTRAESGQEIPAQVDYLKSMSGLNDRQADQAYYNASLLQEKIYGQRLDNEQLRDITMPMQTQNLEVLKATRDALISASQSDATAKSLGLQKLRNMNEVEQGNFGLAINYLDRLIGPVTSAVHAAGAIIP